MVVGMMFWPMPMVMVMPIVGAVRVRAVREPPHAHQAKRLFGLVNGLQLTRIRPVWTPQWYYPFSDFTCGVRRGEASGEDILGSKARYFPDASLQDATRSPLRTPHVKSGKG